MRRVTPWALALFAVIGCFGKPTDTNIALVATSKADVVSPAPAQTNNSPVAGSGQDIANPPSQKPTSIPTSVPVAVVAAQDSEMAIADIEVGDPALEESVQFSTDRAGTVTVQSGVVEGLQLFKVRSDQFGQTEFIGDLHVGQNGIQTVIPSAGMFRVAGKEKPLSFADIPLGGEETSGQYRTQTLEQECPPIDTEIEHFFDGYPAKIRAWTQDTEFPTKTRVYLHRGTGNADLPEDNFQNWVNYNQTISPDKAALADRVHGYVTDKWDSYPAPNIAAEAYNKHRSNCGTPGETYVDVCHSAGCLKAWLALLWRTAGHRTENNLGIIAAAPVMGGSHWSIKELTDASLAFNYREKAAHWGAIRTLVQREWGMLLSPSIQKAVLKEVLAGTRFSIYNEGSRSLAWTGTGTGIPVMNYLWYSLFSFGVPNLKLRLNPDARYTTSVRNPLAEYAPATGAERMFNYIEAVQALDASSGWTNGKMDIAVCYLNDTLASQSVKIRQFEKEYGNDPILALIWRKETEPGFERIFAKAALPWMNAVIAKSPSVVPNDPDANENAVNDGALTACQQLGCLDGQSILAPGSRYGALTINKAAVDARLPNRVASWKEFPGRDHYNAIIGDTELWDWTNKRLIARVDARREKERPYVLTDMDKETIINIISPPLSGARFYGLEDEDGRPTIERTFNLWNSSFSWWQDPLSTGHQSRVRVRGEGRMVQKTARYNYVADVYVPFGAYEEWSWSVKRDFIRRNGVWELVLE